MGFNLFTKPVDVYSRPKQYDTSKSVEENLAQSNTPTAEEISSAYRTPTAQLQMQQGQVQQPVTTPADTVNAQTKPITNMDELAQAMGYTSPQEEERLRKASLTNQRIMAIGDALRHIGNLYYTINGATPQKYNSPVLEEEQRYLRGKAMRDKANHTYLTYKQAKDKQDQQAKQWEAQFALKLADDKRKDALNDARISRYNAQNAKDDANKAYWDTRAKLLEDGWPIDKAIKEANLAKIKAQEELTRVKTAQGGFAPSRRGGGGGSGGKYWAYDQDGKIHYYPNKTMYEQGIAEFSEGLNQTEQLTNTNAYGDRSYREVKVKPTTHGGKLARDAHNGNTKSKFSIHGNDKKKKSNKTNVGSFSIHK